MEQRITNGIYDYHHFHSITHEVLGVCCGYCDVMLGAPGSKKFRLEKGDVIVIPAGVAHKNMGSSDDFKCVGAYPGGADYNIKKGKPEEKAEAEKNIKKVPLPEKDPLYGKDSCKNYGNSFAICQTNFAILLFLVALLCLALRLQDFFCKPLLFLQSLIKCTNNCYSKYTCIFCCI